MKLVAGILLLIGLFGLHARASDPTKGGSSEEFPALQERSVLRDLKAVDEFKKQVGLFTRNPPKTWPKADVEGIVTYRDRVWNMAFVQKGDHAIFAYGDPVSVLEVGQHVQIQGEIRPGELLPVLFANSVEVLADEVDLPEPTAISICETPFGENDSLLVQASGRVLQAFVEPGRAVFYCVEDDVNFYVSISNLSSETIARAYIGAEITCTGALAVQLRKHANEVPEYSEREIESFRIFCPTEAAIKIAAPKKTGQTGEPTSQEDESQAVVTVSELVHGEVQTSRFMTHGQLRHIEEFEDHFEVVLFDEFDSARMRLESVVDLGLGMILRVAGQIEQERDLPLQADYLQLLDYSELPKLHPVRLASIEADGKVDHRFRIRGVLQSKSESPDGKSCVLEIRDGACTAEVKVKDAALRSLDPSNFATGRTVCVTVVLLEKKNSNLGNTTLVFVANEPEALEIEPSSPLPTKTISGFLLCLASILLWTWSLRRQVSQRTRELQQLTANLRSSYDAIEDGVMAMDRSKKVLAVNKEFRRISGLPLNVKDISSDGCQTFASGLLNPTYFNHVLRRCTEDASYSDSFLVEQEEPYRAIQVSTSPIELKEGGSPIGRLWVLRDETEKRQLQKELARSNKLEAVGRLAGGVAHDFNNIITAITSNLAVAQLDPQKTIAEVDGELTMAKEAAFRGADVSRRLLSFSSELDLALQPCSINQLIKDFAKLVRHSFDASIEFNFSFDRRDLVGNVERAAIEQVLMNLYCNARDAMPNGGRIETETTLVESDDDRFARIIVRDSGVGIPADVQEKIFDPFYSTKGPQDGTGLGLSTSYRVIKEHGGRLQLATNPKAGWTELWIDLPLCSEAPRREVVEERTIPGGLRVLVVDDEKYVRTAACRILESQGFETEEAADGKQALDYLADNQSSIQLVLLDLTMPGISGTQVLSAIKKRWPQMPVIICSGYLVDDLKMADGFKPDAVVTKPYRVADLLAAFERVTAADRPSNTRLDAA